MTASRKHVGAPEFCCMFVSDYVWLVLCEDLSLLQPQLAHNFCRSSTKALVCHIHSTFYVATLWISPYCAKPSMFLVVAALCDFFQLPNGSCDHQLRKSFLTSMATFKKTRGMHTKAGCWMVLGWQAADAGRGWRKMIAMRFEDRYGYYMVIVVVKKLLHRFYMFFFDLFCYYGF